MHKRLIPLILITFLSISIFAQHVRWISLSATDLDRLDVQDQAITPSEYSTFYTDFEALASYLQTNKESEFTLEVPFPDGSIQEFKCSNATLIPEGLQAKYPSILSFDGKGVSVRGSRMKFGISPKGFHAMVLVPGSSPVFVDILSAGRTSHYMSYYKKNYEPQQSFTCHFEGDTNIKEEDIESKNIAGDCQLRSYRLALACSGEYATFHGGTKESTLAEYAIAMARVNGIYEKDVGVTMIFVDNTDEVIFLDAATDPYTNNSGGAMLGENQATLDNVIGTENYDIGHVFSTGGGGVAALQAPCNNSRKARGVTGLPSPINDPFYVDYVSHEMGHQFGANHTQNNDCNRVAATAMEVGSANTIMGYAGICAPNSQNNSDDHFHAISIFEISNYIVGGNGDSCDEVLAMDNNQPTVSISQPSFNIPGQTPFMLKADANDIDGDVLTYCWEQMDNEFADMPPLPTNTGGPSFISNSPLLSDTRIFPNMQAIVNNQSPEWEVLSSVTREMNFRVTVRDNGTQLGCTTEADVILNVDGDVGPFLVEIPNTNVTWQVATEEVVEWDVANTDGGTINCALVDILLSVDGGFNYPITLAEQVPNDGSHVITVPAESTTTARVMVKCSDNIFFDISNTNFTIETPFSFTFDQQEVSVCEGEQAAIEISTAGFDGFTDAINFSIDNMPAGVDFAFTDNPVNTPESTTLNLTNISPLPGAYTFNVIAEAGDLVVSQDIELFVEPNNVDALNLLEPEDGAVGVLSSTNLTWSPAPGINSYQIMVSKSPDFADPIIIIANDVNTVSLENLEINTVYYWRAQANTLCAIDTNSETFAFQTELDAICNIQPSVDIPLEIPGDAVGAFESTLQVEDVSSYQFMRCFIDLDHTYLGDVIYTLISPEGTQVILMDQIGVPASQFGCAQDDMTVTFSDQSINTADQLEGSCGEYESDYQPVESFDAFAGQDVNGEWKLVVEDVFDQDGGQVTNWNLEFCSVAEEGEIQLVNEILVVPFAGTRTVSMDELEIVSTNPESTLFTLLATPEHGELIRYLTGTSGDFEVMQLGSTFTQQDVDNGSMEYQHNGDEANVDLFRFDALDDMNRWAHDQTFNIIIAADGEAVVIPSIGSPVLCNADLTGEIVINVVGGNGPFTYSIDGGENFEVDSVFTDLGAGEYEVVVLDNNGLNIYEEIVIITQPDVLSVEAMSVFYDIVASGTGGTESYTYSINGIDFFDISTFTDLDPGVYIVTIRDENGCESTTDIEHSYAPIELNSVVSDVTCFGASTGEIQLSAVGGFSPYTYSINGVDYDDTGFYDNLPAGDYTVYITDAGGKIISQVVTITQGDQISFVLEGSADDFIVQNVTGGTAPFEYSINDVDYVDSPIFDPLPTGSFTIYVRDANGCTESLTYNEIGAQVSAAATLCAGDETGVFTAFGFGGFPPLQYSIDGVNFQESETFMDLAAGDYTVTIVDQYGFQNTIEVEILSPDPITVTTEYIGGELIITAEGGTGIYMYSIDGGMTFQSSNTFSIDMDGDYAIVVTDDNDCIDETMLTVTLVDNKDVELAALINIYPVPVLETLFVELDPSIMGSITMKVYDLLGQELSFTAVQNSNKISIDFSNWTAGQYLLVLQSDETVITRKILKF